MELSIKADNPKLKIHPLFILLGIFYLVIGSGFIFISYLISVVIHELAHARVARIRGYSLGQIVLMPYGAVLKGGEDFPRLDSVLIAVAGPITNLILALFIIALWWLVPDLYTYTESLMWANLSLAIFNLIPVFPLDGARVILALSSEKGKCLKRLRVIGIALSIVLVVTMIVSIFYTFNISLGIMALFIMHGAVSGTDRELYHHIMTMDNFSKTMVDAILFMDIGISERAELYRYLECVRRDRIVTFHVLDDDMREVGIYSEEELRDIILVSSLSDRFVDALSSYETNKTAQNSILDVECTPK